MNYEEIKIGEEYGFEKLIKEEDVLKFAQLTGDFNKLHVDKEYGEKSIFKKNVVHGMLLGGFFSALIGMHCPGENSLYLWQTLNFKSPVFCGDKIMVRGTVLAKNDSVRIITLKTEIIKNGNVAISGEAKVKLLN